MTAFWIAVVLLVYVVAFTVVGKQGKGPLFRLSSGASVWQVALSLLVATVGLPFIGVLSSLVVTQGEVGFWFIASNALGAGFIIWIYGPMWASLDLVHENAFLTIRYAQPWANRLLRFRGWYVGALVNALLLAMLLRSFSDVLGFLLHMPSTTVLWLCVGFLLLNSWRITFRQKQWMDVIHLLFIAIFLVLSVGYLLFESVDPVTPSTAAAATMGAFPYQHTVFASAFWVYIGLQWWSATLFDGSGVVAQRIMGRSKRVAIQSLLFYFLLLAIIVPVIAFLAFLGQSWLGTGESADLAVFAWLDAQWTGSRLLLGLLLLPLFVGIAEAQINWSGSLISSTMPRAGSQWQRGAMVLVVLLAAVFLLFFATLFSLFQLFIGISAGVSLVFLLRWWVPYINGLVQLAAMLGATIISAGMTLIQRWAYSNQPSHEQYVNTLLVTTVGVVFICVVVALVSFTAKDREAYQQFREKYTIQRPTFQQLVLAVTTGIALTGLSYGIWRWLLYL